MREEIDKKIEKMLEPPPSRKIKALPIPAEGGKRKRGGRRYDPVLFFLYFHRGNGEGEKELYF